MVASDVASKGLDFNVNHVVNFDNNANVLLYTLTGGQTFYVTDIILTLSNTDTGDPARFNIRDGLTVGAGSLKLPIIAGESPNSSSTITTYTHSFSEPMKFTVGVFLDLISGDTPTVAGFMEGYLE